MRVLVYIVVGYIIFAYSSNWLINVLPFSQEWFHTPTGILKVLVLKFLLVMTLVNYFYCITTAPGVPPAGWIPPSATQEELEEAKRVASQKPHRRHELQYKPCRYCVRCDSFKPPRTHHCSDCRMCILKMDHHCPWINNCVGFHNHKYFYLFVFYAALGCVYIILLYASTLYHLISDAKHTLSDNEGTSVVKGITLTLNICLLIPITIGLVSLCAWQTKLIKDGTTTIEVYQKHWERQRSQKKPYQWKYDLGSLKNFKIFLGSSYFIWGLPIPSDILQNPRFESGTDFPTRYEMPTAVNLTLV